jgi:hypothetical protein
MKVKVEEEHRNESEKNCEETRIGGMLFVGIEEGGIKALRQGIGTL